MPGPGKPTITAIGGIGYTSANLSFSYTDPPGYENEYLVEIERKEAGGSFSLIETINGTPLSFPDTGLSDGKAWVWRIRAQDSYGNYSPYSDEVGATTLLPPAGKPAVSATPTGAVFTWPDNSQNEDNFDVYMTYAGGSTYHLEATKGQNVTSHSVSGLDPGQYYKVKIVARNSIISADESPETIFFTDDPPNAPSDLVLTTTGTTKIRANAQDNASNETGFLWEWGTDGTTFPDSASTGANVCTYEITGLTSNVLYYVRVKAVNASGYSAASNVASASTFAAVAKPTNLRLTSFKVAGVLGIEAIFDDNSELETDHRLERSLTPAFAEIVTNGGFSADTSGWTADNYNCTLAAVSGGYSGKCLQITRTGGSYQDAYQALTLITGKTYFVSGRVKSGTSGNEAYKIYDNVGGGGSYAAPLITGTSSGAWVYFSGLYVATGTTGSLKVMKDSATPGTMLFDSISIIDWYAFAEVKTLEPNRTYYFDGPLTAGVAYSYAVRARQSGSPDVYSAYSDIVSCTVMAAPAAPTGPAVSEYQDTWARMTWAPAAGAAFYEVYKALHSGSFTLYRTVIAGCEYCKVNGLSPSTAYDFKVRSVNAAGSSAYTSTVTQTTRAAYLRSDFEKLQLKTKPKDWVNLVEINPTITLKGWTLVSGKTYTYKRVLSESAGIRIEAVTENGEDLAIETSITAVEAAAGSFYFDYAAQIAYVHPSGSNDPVNYLFIGSFWKCFSTGDPSDIGSQQPIVFDGDHYVPLLPVDGIPDITQTIEPYYKGSFVPTHGSITLTNGISPGWGNVGYFDKLSFRYNWKNRTVRVLAGRRAWTYSQFFVISSGITQSVNFTDAAATFTLRDYREGLNRDLPKYDFWESEFPNLDTNTNVRGNVRPEHYGPVIGFALPCIDIVNRVFELNNGRIPSVANVYKNDVALTAGTDYFIDYQRGQITLARGLAYESTDRITADFTGIIDDMGNAIAIGPLILLDILARSSKLGLSLAAINLDSFYEAAEVATTTLSLSLYKKRSFQECVELIEKSCMGWTYQDNLGRLCFRVLQTTAQTGALHIQNARIQEGFAVDDPIDNTYAGVDVGYAEDFGGVFQKVRKTNYPAQWEDGVQEILGIDTAIPSAADAAALGSSIVAVLNKPIITIPVDRCLYTALPGDVIYFSRDRYPSEEGVALNVPVVILEITKSQSSGTTSITAIEAA